MRLSIVIIAAILIAFTWPFWLPALQAGEETFDADVTTVELEYGVDSYTSGRWAVLNSSTPTTVGLDASTASIGENSSFRMFSKYDLSDIPSDQAIIASHLTITVQKNASVGTRDQSFAVFRVTRATDFVGICWDSAATGQLWAVAGADSGVSNRNQVEWGDTIQVSTEYDRLLHPDGVMSLGGSNSGKPAAGDSLFVDMTEMVRRWHSGQWDNHGFLLMEYDENDVLTLGGNITFRLNGTSAGLRPRLTVVYGPINEAGSGSGSGSSRIGRGDRGVYN